MSSATTTCSSKVSMTKFSLHEILYQTVFSTCASIHMVLWKWSKKSGRFLYRPSLGLAHPLLAVKSVTAWSELGRPGSTRWPGFDQRCRGKTARKTSFWMFAGLGTGSCSAPSSTHHSEPSRTVLNSLNKQFFVNNLMLFLWIPTLWFVFSLRYRKVCPKLMIYLLNCLNYCMIPSQCVNEDP
jgi:hypothetical protein